MRTIGFTKNAIHLIGDDNKSRALRQTLARQKRVQALKEGQASPAD